MLVRGLALSRAEGACPELAEGACPELAEGSPSAVDQVVHQLQGVIIAGRNDLV